MSTNKIKIEPGTTSKLTNVLKYATEQGISGRLASLKIPRDLKLGASKSKVAFKPNLVERKKKTDCASSASPQPGRGRGRGGRGRGQSERGRGRGRGHANSYIQSQGVFSEGIAEAMGAKRNAMYNERSYGGKDGDVAKMMDKPTINKNSDYKVDKEHEDKVMQELLDDHIEQDEDIHNDQHPITLPTSKHAKLYGLKEEEKKHVKKIIKEELNEDLPKVIVKQELEIKQEIDEKQFDATTMEKHLFDIQEQLLLFQFPDCLPGIGPIIEPETKPNSASGDTNTTATDNVEVRNKCTLRDISEGKVGKILLYKSGKSKLVIGNSTFDIDEGFNPGFLQDVVSVVANSTTNSGDMINLGSVDSSVVITPQFDDLLQKK